jgi:lipopolysaccharide/colanic/teichoic acid biosynthesis glycosyltransferase
MIPDAEKLSGPKFAEKDDPRITGIGKILRACRLDELPQILNILKGDMSVVGPRPERPMFVEQFEQEIENYDYRFEVKAGLTSLSHVYGRYSTYIHDRTYYDLFYIMHYSLLLDIKIILLTAKTMFMKSAAEGEDDFKTKTVAKEESEVNS